MAENGTHGHYGTSAEPSITMPLGAGGGQLRWNGSGGFYALGEPVGCDCQSGRRAAPLTWNVGGFVPDGHA